MKLYETITAGGVEYKLKITALRAVELERELETDLLSGLEKLTNVATLGKYYYAAMQSMNDICGICDVYSMFDDYITDGGTYEKLQELLVETLVTSGIMTREAYDSSKKIMEKQKEALKKLSE